MNGAEVWIDDATLGGSMRVGRLTRSASRSGDTLHFEYDDRWLDDAGPVRAFALDPELGLTAGPHYARAGAGALTGAFLDASPDRWGKQLMDRREAIEARAQARAPRSLRAWDHLLGVHDLGRMGALRLKDPDAARFVDDGPLGAPPITALRELEAVAAQVESGAVGDAQDEIRWIRQLVAPGASLGGARPKASFTDTDGQLWLAKFPSGEDRHDVGLWEYLTHQLSLSAGIAMPEARLLELSSRGHTYAVKRFDRMQGSRRAFCSAMTRLDVDTSEGGSYLDIIQAIEGGGTSTRIAQDLEQLFRRVLFNILVGNRDDHLRNHGFLREGDGWRLSPAFDVNPNPHKDNHVLALDEAETSPDSGLLLATSDYYRLDAKRAEAIAGEVRAAVREWESRARTLGARGADVSLMRAVIDPER
ncbi:type II toxin-antitoxin system HipA family toxin [Alkalisalibacterium limincola]|uniref:Type II toxin-antitoxin system HipA family toxin n=1 Tax=Alkalisalibacterium limincola TaxID=2699169 RepID=A0A5C8KL24_9GAMM|nr:HipA domain-containing protein [Alkalisalibacterium limincola]TXK61017.1 type II toxin-antitoxin system HipA family toxin [Alkalisalibacterium limincola]